ncbi:MAG TPA: hypothetical protein VG204_19390 [Terriglobia bacterium]|nr:hypothetical protein [Terriglobia bacterium]
MWDEGGRKHGVVQEKHLPGSRAFFKKVSARLKQQGMSLPQAVFDYLCWLKWRKLPQELLRPMAAGYDLETFDKLAHVARVFYKWHYGKIDYRRDFRVKGDERHVFLMYSGVAEGGIERLTERELADFFDAVCPCNEPHSEDALKKLRERTRRKLLLSVKAGGRKIRPTPGAHA